MSRTEGTKWKNFFRVAIFIVKWLAISSALLISYQESRDVFILIGIAVIAYQSVKAVKATTENKEWDLYAEMVGVYQHCAYKNYNASVIWDMCKKVRDKGAVFDGVMYDLLEKQIKKA
ncbi:hypothetical protein [Methylohalobius crimeensis]|uniref:hypothetical protein n=1 Tax=Methylohalobius crimeensis TaxID=244365 RepID=UPI0003B4116F|nr:hypothetical protein [Methylohalobius crimeensis]